MRCSQKFCLPFGCRFVPGGSYVGNLLHTSQVKFYTERDWLGRTMGMIWPLLHKSLEARR